MREIKFRVWDGKSFAYFSLFDLATGQPTEYLFREASTFSEYAAVRRYIDGLVIEQYTGLKDKSDQEVYEGDIVVFRDDYRTYNSVVVWDEGNAWFGTDDPAGSDSLSAVCTRNNRVDGNVIGNIHQNPELMEAI